MIRRFPVEDLGSASATGGISREADDASAVGAHLRSLIPQLHREPDGVFPRAYLAVSPDNYGGNLFVWDHYHMGLRLALDGRPEYCRNLCENVFHYQEPDGFTPNCIIRGRGPRNSASRFHAQPYLARAAWAYWDRTRDSAWVRSAVAPLQAYLDYYDREHATRVGLHRWAEPFHSGFDNDVVTSFHLPGSVVSCDLSSLLVLEQEALAALREASGEGGADRSRARAREIAGAVRDILWCGEMESFAAFDLMAGRHVFSLEGWAPGDRWGEFAYQSCSNLLPLYAGIATPEMADRMLRRYVLDAEHFWSDLGVRSLSRASEFYNNAVWGNPPRHGDHRRTTNSNWQGPVWVPLNFFVHRALHRYGFPSEAAALSGNTLRVLALSLAKVGSFAENFCGDSGVPLYARHFGAWNLLGDIFDRDMPFEFAPRAPHVSA